MNRKNVVATIYVDGSNAGTPVNAGELVKTLNEYREEIDTLIEDSYEIIEGGGDIFTIDLHPEVDSDIILIFKNKGTARIKQGMYAILNNAYISGDGSKKLKSGLLILTDKENVIALDGVELIPIKIHFKTEDESQPDGALWALQETESGEFATLGKALEALSVLASLRIISDKYGISVNLDNGEDEGRTLLSIKTNAIKEIDFTTDKVNRETWNQWANLEPGQIALGFSEDGTGELGINLANPKDRKRGIQRVMTYSINFEELEDAGIAPRLEPYDRRVYEALSSLWGHVTNDTGQETFSLKDIHYAMGYTSEPSSGAKKKINDSITKMSRAHIAVDNFDESSVYKYPHFKYDASLLPMERITGYVDGQITDGLIHLFREPPLFTFAREREQFTSYSVRLLQTPLNKTNKNLMVEDYIREQIAWMKNKGSSANRSNKITFADLFKEARIVRRDDKARQKKNVVKLLEHYIKCGWIEGYKEAADGFTIFY